MGKKNKNKKKGVTKQARQMVTPTVAAMLGAIGTALFLRRDRVKPYVERKLGRDRVQPTAHAAE